MKQGGRREQKEKQSMLREAELGDEDLGRVGEEDLTDPTEEIVIEKP
jgi:hypothetical protein